MNTFPCISLWQPYASLVGFDAKPFETRHWPAPARVIGRTIAIHAAARKPTRFEVGEMDVPVQKALQLRRWEQMIPYGAVVCLARLTGSYQVIGKVGRNPVLSDGRQITDDGFGDYSIGRFCWELDQVRRLARPVPTKGMQGWWNWTAPDGVIL